MAKLSIFAWWFGPKQLLSWSFQTDVSLSSLPVCSALNTQGFTHFCVCFYSLYHVLDLSCYSSFAHVPRRDNSLNSRWHLLLILSHETSSEPFFPPAIKSCILVAAFCFLWTHQGRNIIRYLKLQSWLRGNMKAPRLCLAFQSWEGDRPNNLHSFLSSRLGFWGVGCCPKQLWGNKIWLIEVGE